ncbi:MAG: acyl-CoA dehydratase activase [Thermodesulfobacteriota bacterium]|nr:acyl-CoA dehydratase activase [Thermodesulfobacteriota bacterium]
MTKNKPQNVQQADRYFEGIEIGAVSVKWVLRTQNGELTPIIAQHGGNPKKKVQELIEKHPNSNASRIVITGEAARVLFDLPYRSETECIEKALAFNSLEPDIVLSLGGETFSVYSLKSGMIKNIISTTKCAAGTGEFIVQQFKRMGLSLEQGLKQSEGGKLVQLATRCSVHCKSDATHKLNKGECTSGDIAKSLIHDLAEKVSKMVEIAKWPTRLILVCGGVANNRFFIENLRQFFNDSEVMVLPHSPYLEAFGASLYASELPENITIPRSDKWIKPLSLVFETLNELKQAESLLDYKVQFDVKKKIVPDAKYILGVDAGSTTTKAVLFNLSDGSIAASCYLRTLGNPVQATKNCLNELINQVGNVPIKIIQAGVTGSGREVVSVYLDNCRSFNEILAHARAASEHVPDVDTVFEIGGQDSKFISFLKGVPIDYAMNEGCSAGTGSFLEESASVDMGVAMKDISIIAIRSKHPIAFGERCAAFINTDLRNALQQGANQEDVVAGLVYSIADNYISRIVGARHIGENLLFLGGVALNKSVALAIASRTQRKVVVPPHPELMGCVGTALMTRDLLQDGDIAETTQNLKDLAEGKMEIKGSFSCKTCENRCEIQKIAIRNKTYPFGGLCSKYEIQRHKSGEIKEGKDLVAVRTQMMFDEFGPYTLQNPRGNIGLPMALTTLELFPFYAKLINELGYNVILSNPSKEGNAKTRGAMCYPCELVHGAVYDLMCRDVDFILLPHVIDMEIPDGHSLSYTCPTTTIMPGLIRGAFEEISDRILAPHIGLSKDLIRVTLKEIGRLGSILGIKSKTAKKAGENALSHYERFVEKYHRYGEEEFNTLIKDPTVIIAGRPYTTCLSDVNLALPRKIISRGYNVIPSDILPRSDNGFQIGNVWHFTQQITNAVDLVKKIPNLYICLVSCFSCGPDASVYHYVRQELAGKTFCYLEIDSHTAHAGFETRVGAFIDIIEERRRRGEA